MEPGVRVGRGLGLLWLACVACWPGDAKATEPDAFENSLMVQLQKLDPTSVETFRQANKARDSKDYSNASHLYAEVARRVPSFSAAIRRQCGVEAQARHHETAVKLCRQALDTENNAENKAALANVLLQAPEGRSSASSSDRMDAMRLATEAARAKPNDVVTNGVLCQAAIALGDVPTLRLCARQLKWLAPRDPTSHFMLAILAASEGRFDDALLAVDEAHRLGMPDDDYQTLRNRIVEARPLSSSVGPSAARAAVAWAIGLLALFGLGAILSRITLASVSELPTTRDGKPQASDRALRKGYGLVLWICCAYYYLSLPLVALAVVAAAGGLIYAFFAIGHVPVKLVLLIGLLVPITVWAMVKSLLVRGKAEDPGRRLDLAEHPRLRDALGEVAERVGTRMVDEVFLTPGTEVAVFERGGVLRQLARRADRCLVLGAGVLEGMKVIELKSVLAHEYGHLQNEDTAGGGFALAVRRSLLTMAGALASGGAAVWYNPAWWFIQGFYRIFLRISHGASRLQEVLADRWAALSYGSAVFEKALTHVILRSVRFDDHIHRTIAEVVDAKCGLANLYTYAPTPKPDTAAALEKQSEEALHRKASPYDSHPAPGDRLALIRALGAEGRSPSAGDDEPAWSLLSNREALENQMTDRVRAMIGEQLGVHIEGC